MENFQLRVDSINDKDNPDEEEQQIQTRINIKKEKRAAMYQEVEMLRQLRKEEERKREKERLEREEMNLVEQRRKEEETRKREEELKKKEEEIQREEDAKQRYLINF